MDIKFKVDGKKRKENTRNFESSINYSLIPSEMMGLFEDLVLLPDGYTIERDIEVLRSKIEKDKTASNVEELKIIKEMKDKGEIEESIYQTLKKDLEFKSIDTELEKFVNSYYIEDSFVESGYILPFDFYIKELNLEYLNEIQKRFIGNGDVSLKDGIDLMIYLQENLDKTLGIFADSLYVRFNDKEYVKLLNSKGKANANDLLTFLFSSSNPDKEMMKRYVNIIVMVIMKAFGESMDKGKSHKAIKKK